MFQYAFGRRLALKNDAELCLDTSGYDAVGTAGNSSSVRLIGLSHFRIEAQLTPDPYHESGAKVPVRRWLRKARDVTAWIADRPKPYFRRHQIIEPIHGRFRFDQRVLDLEVRDAITVRGFWQSEAYFLDVQDHIRRELVVREEPRGNNAEWARRIRATNAVAIHVRHGDNADGVAPELGVLPREYYVRALTEIRREVEAADFFVFSDDIPWSREWLSSDVPMVFVDQNTSVNSHEDMRLMTMCRHHILANSTFGWWGAWLAKIPYQIVIAPRRYYQGADRPNPDLYPAHWRLL